MNLNRTIQFRVQEALKRVRAKKKVAGDFSVVGVGIWCHRVNEGPWVIEQPNLVVNEGLNDLLNVCLNNGPQSASWYVALYKGLSSPAPTTTAATFDSDLTELIEYDETTHPLWDRDPPASQTISNTARPARFTINANVTATGGGLMNTATKPTPNSGNILMAAKDFTVARTLQPADKFDVAYTLTISSV